MILSAAFNAYVSLPFMIDMTQVRTYAVGAILAISAIESVEKIEPTMTTK
jgi:hypothetical protein